MRKKTKQATVLVVTLMLTMAVFVPGVAAQSPWSPRTQSDQQSLCKGYIWCEGLQGSGIVLSSRFGRASGYVTLQIDTFAGESRSDELWYAGGNVSLEGFPLGSFTSSAIWTDNIVENCLTSCVYEVRGEGTLNHRNVTFMLTYEPNTGVLTFNAWDARSYANVGALQGQYYGNMTIHSPWEY
jgi:hypothetical protein